MFVRGGTNVKLRAREEREKAKARERAEGFEGCGVERPVSVMDTGCQAILRKGG
jgi:hypothetical protein